MNEELNQYDVYCDDDYLEVPETIEMADDVLASLMAYIDRTRVLLAENNALAIEFKVDVPHKMLDTDGEEFDKYKRLDWSYTVLRIDSYSAVVEFGTGNTKIWICI